MKKILLSLTIILLLPLVLFAQEDITVEQLMGGDPQNSEIEELEKIEEERIQQKANLLGFVLPEYSDNPSYVITFKDPSPDEQGVEIDIDEKGFQKITSPYSFPALNIGPHDIRFRFNDENGYVQILEYEFLVIPRPPIINSPAIEDLTVTIGGTSLPNSEVLYSLVANAFSVKDIVKADASGNWIVEISLEGKSSEAIYSFSAYTRKYGYASNLSDAVTFAIGDIDYEVDNGKTKEIYFSFKDFFSANTLDVLKSNSDLIILILLPLFVGTLLTLFLKNVTDSKRKNKETKETERIIAKNSNSEEKTLREIFGEKEEAVDEEIKSSSKKKKEETEEKKETKIINKDVFLKTYKHIDPDSGSGKENDSKEIKKRIKVSLTSKKEK